MRYVNLGGAKVSQVCLGTWHLPPSKEVDQFGVPKVDEELSIKIMKKAMDLGVNCIDTANGYHGVLQTEEPHHVGNAERIVGKFLSQLDRESVFLATKVRAPISPRPNGEGLSRKHVRWQLRESLKRLNTDYVDLYQLHWPDPTVPKMEVATTLYWAQSQGYVNYLGLSNHPAHDVVQFDHLLKSLGSEGLSSVQDPYNLLDRRFEESRAVTAKELGLTLLAFVPTAQGVLTGKYLAGGSWKVPEGSRATYVKEVGRYFNDRNLKVVKEVVRVAEEVGATPAQVAIAWVIGMGEAMSVKTIPLIGATRVEHVEEDVEAVDVKLSDDVMKRLDEVSRT
ncbi:voltage-gated potassium channel [Sulfodiicoccus acidiphilus]|uniref:Voltage-gated potassium channel n=1 Tax=Sulfodiicoccus acidiphilus TaxID=1670455 RepID=A0A348B538_9CREN|nr:aldo/keto reductase [Sulfodiicoccus acidiphilus]BBD73290.1 voltage-gated potassium channel [Sulfodiicoccus acidiphilus]GGT89337.1 voltage-gated potassium channel [Sulfodiicoccus acidiphilus]